MAGTFFRLLGEGNQRDTNEHPNYSVAATFDRIAVVLGNDRARTNLGILYMNGWGVEKDADQATALFTKAAENGDTKAPRYLGLLALEAGDAGEADAWFTRGVDAGDFTSMIRLGELYLNGIGVEQDYEKARELFERATEREDHVTAEAMTFLGQMYEEGLGVEADPDQARNWYEKAEAAVVK